MSDQSKWMPSDEAIMDLLCGHESPEQAVAEIKDTIQEAIEKALAEREARHRREVIEARIEELTKYAYCGCDTEGYACEPCLRLDALRAELAALDKEAKGE